MCDLLTQKLMNTAEKLNWTVAVDMGTEWEFRQRSPAGENFVFSVWSNHIDDIAYKVREYAKGFDTEVHAMMWANAKRKLSGFPDIRKLLDDAEDIQEMLCDLASALIETTKEVSDYV